MSHFLLVSTRPDEEALDSEYEAYRRAAGLQTDELDLAEFDLVGLPSIDLSRYDGVFVAGSPFGNATIDRRASKTQKWVGEELGAFFQQILDADIACLAAGTSMTVLGSVIGASLTDDYAQIASIAEVTLTPEGRKDPLLQGVAESFPAFVSYSESCAALPDTAVRLAWSLSCPIQMFRYGRAIYAAQFSPELDGKGIEDQLQRYADAGGFSVAEADILVATGRHSGSTHAGSSLLRRFVDLFG